MTVRPQSRSPYLMLPGFEARLPAKHRQNLRRCERKLGAIELERITDFSRAALGDALALEALAWKGAAGTSIDSSLALRHFYTALARLGARRGQLSLCFLRAGGRRVAFALIDGRARGRAAPALPGADRRRPRRRGARAAGARAVASVPPGAWLAVSRPRWSIVAAIFGFGAPLSVASLSEYASQSWDNLLVSRLYGPGVMGVYKLAYNLADVPTVGVAAVSTTLVDALFTDEWAGIAPMLAILSAMSIARPLSWAAVTFLQAERRVRTLMALAAMKLVALLAAISTVGRLGPLWTCGAVSIVIAAHTAALLAVARRMRGVPLALAPEIVPPLLACLPMAASVFAVRGLLGGAAPMLLLVAEIAAGAVVYGVAASLLAPRQRAHLVHLVRQAWRRRAIDAPGG